MINFALFLILSTIFFILFLIDQFFQNLKNRKLDLRREVIPKAIFLYCEIKIHYHKLLDKFRLMFLLIEKSNVLMEMYKTRKLRILFLYYDNPMTVKNIDDCRSCYGIALESNFINNEIRDLAKEVNLNSEAELEDISIIFSPTKYNGKLSVIYGFMSIIPSLYKNCRIKGFKIDFRIMGLYITNDNMNFFVPSFQENEKIKSYLNIMKSYPPPEKIQQSKTKN